MRITIPSLRAFLGAVFLIVALLFAAQPAVAQEAGGAAYGQISEISTNPGEDAGPDQYAAAAQELSMLSETQLSIERVRKRSGEILRHMPQVVPDILSHLRAKSPTGEARYFPSLLGWTLLFFAIAYLIEWQIYGVRLCGPWFVSLQKPHPDGLVEKLPILALRATIGMVGILLSLVMVSMMIAGYLDTSSDITQKTLIVIMLSVAAARTSAIIWRMVLSPYLPNYRIPCLDDRESRKLFGWLWSTIAVSIGLLAFCYWLEDIGAKLLTHNAVTLVATAIMVIVNIAMVVVNRKAISRAILGECNIVETTRLQRFSSAVWAPLAIIYFIAASLILTYRLLSGSVSGAPLVVGAYTVLLAILVAYGVVAFVIARVFRRRRSIFIAQQRAEARVAERDEEMRIVDQAYIEGDPLSGDGDEDSGPAAGGVPGGFASKNAAMLHGMRDFEALAKRTASIFAFGAGIYALLHIWDFDYLVDEGGALDPVQDVIDICLIGYLLYHATRIWIDTRIEEEVGDDAEPAPGDEGGGASAASRLATLLPLFRNFLLFTISISAMVMVLLKMGINVAPLFAGAGVVGIAIGFGAQTLIRDILSGMFYLFDDAFRKGEYIDIGTVKGTVEKISIRSFQLRHHLGALHTIPFGEITHLTNYSRDWVMVKLPIRVTYDTDIEKVRKLIKKLGAELSEHPIEGPKFLQPLKSQGIYKMEDSAMIMRVKFMTRPGDQWTTRKLVYSRLRELFAEHGIKFAHREVTVRLSEAELATLPPDQRDAAAGAALTAVATAEEELLGRPKVVGDDR